ncbi:MAG: hypothetical protein V4679_07770 [Pseudomonadota bacterium]
MALAAATGAPTLWWLLHQQHLPTEAIATAQAFVRDVEQRDHAAAFGRTLAGPATGTTPLQLQANAQRQLCPPARLDYTLPFQSHGNRLRRWAAGRTLDEPQVRVEFVGSPCLFGITLRRTADGQWKVVGFSSHAG